MEKTIINTVENALALLESALASRKVDVAEVVLELLQKALLIKSQGGANANNVILRLCELGKKYKYPLARFINFINEVYDVSIKCDVITKKVTILGNFAKDEKNGFYSVHRENGAKCFLASINKATFKSWQDSQKEVRTNEEKAREGLQKLLKIVNKQVLLKLLNN